jgi:hypothetical protein
VFCSWFAGIGGSVPSVHERQPGLAPFGSRRQTGTTGASALRLTKTKGELGIRKYGIWNFSLAYGLVALILTRRVSEGFCGIVRPSLTRRVVLFPLPAANLLRQLADTLRVRRTAFGLLLGHRLAARVYGYSIVWQKPVDYQTKSRYWLSQGEGELLLGRDS